MHEARTKGSKGTADLYSGHLDRGPACIQSSCEGIGKCKSYHPHRDIYIRQSGARRGSQETSEPGRGAQHPRLHERKQEQCKTDLRAQATQRQDLSVRGCVLASRHLAHFFVETGDDARSHLAAPRGNMGRCARHEDLVRACEMSAIPHVGTKHAAWPAYRCPLFGARRRP